MMSSTQKYVNWVKENYPRDVPAKKGIQFIPPDYKEGKTLDMLARFLLYTDSGHNVILNGVTGTGKTTLLEYIAGEKQKPIHLVPPVKELKYSDVVGCLMETSGKEFVHLPGPLTRFLVFGGYLGFDEMANLNSRIAISLHGLLQGKSIEISNTQYGPIELTPEHGTHKIVGTGNFAYQKPQFNRATLQRCIFMDVNPLSDDLFKKDLLGETASTKSMEMYERLLQHLYPWKYAVNTSLSTARYGWVRAVKGGVEKQEALATMCTDLRKEVVSFKGFGNDTLDVSNAAFKRIISLYTPKLGIESFIDIVLENLANPISVEYARRDAQKEEFNAWIAKSVKKFAPTLVE